MTPTPALCPTTIRLTPLGSYRRASLWYDDWRFERARDVTVDRREVTLPPIPAHLAAMAMEGR